MNFSKFFSSHAARVPVAGQPAAKSAALEHLCQNYKSEVKSFYAYMPADLQATFINDAMYHQKRYLDMLSLDLGHAFPYADGSIDGIIFTEVLEHLFRDPSWAIYQMNRVLRLEGTLFLTTPNACGYDVLVNLLSQVNPNGRNQFYEAIESGHPHLWTADECRDILQVHGFAISEITTVDHYDIRCPDAVRQFLNQQSAKPDLNGQVLRIVATKQRDVVGPRYPISLYPQGNPVRLKGALRKWAEQILREDAQGATQSN